MWTCRNRYGQQYRKSRLAYFEIDVAEHMLLGVAFDALRPVEERHLQAGRLLSGQTEHFGHMVDLEHYRALVLGFFLCLFSQCNFQP